jgi:hypothetical protein
MFKNPKTEATVTIRKTPRGAAAIVPEWIADDPYFAFCTSGDDPALTVLGRGTKIPKSKQIEVPVVGPSGTGTVKKAKPENDGLGGAVKPFTL